MQSCTHHDGPKPAAAAADEALSPRRGRPGAAPEARHVLPRSSGRPHGGGRRPGVVRAAATTPTTAACSRAASPLFCDGAPRLRSLHGRGTRRPRRGGLRGCRRRRQRAAGPRRRRPAAARTWTGPIGRPGGSEAAPPLCRLRAPPRTSCEPGTRRRGQGGLRRGAGRRHCAAGRRRCRPAAARTWRGRPGRPTGSEPTQPLR